jgi:hypothetical protein
LSEGSYEFWKRYLDVFERVIVLARIRDVFEVPSAYKRSDGESVFFKALPYYIGPLQYIIKSRQVGKAIRNAERLDILSVLS